MSQFHILPEHEITDFNRPPRFDKTQRMTVFALDARTHKILRSIQQSKPENKVGFMIQLGYFKATKKFFTIDKFRNADIYYVAELLNLKVTPQSLKENYRVKTHNNHTAKILEFLGHEPWKHYDDLISEQVAELVAKQLHPKQIMLSVIDVLHEKKISTPSYDHFCKVITTHYRDFEDELIAKLKSLISSEHEKSLDDLLYEGDPARRKLLTNLKTICQSTAKGKISESLHKYLILKRIYMEIEDLVKALDLSSEAIRYYAGWVIKAHTKAQIFEIEDKYKQYLYLTAFIVFQYRNYDDTFLDIILKCVKNYSTAVEKAFDAKKLERAEENDDLSEEVLDGYQSKTKMLNQARSVIHSEDMDNISKLNLLKLIIPLEVSDKEQQADQSAENLNKKLSEEEIKNIFYDVMIEKSDSLHGKIGDIIKHLQFTINNEALSKAIHYYQTTTKITKNAPYDHLSSDEYKAIYKREKFNPKLYKSFLFMHIFENVRNGTISLIHSYKYLPIESYMINEEQWQKNRKVVLARLGLEKFADIDQLLTELQNKLDNAYYDINQRVLSRENKHVRYSKNGQFVINTPAVEKPDYDGLAQLFSHFENIPILNIIRDIDAYTNFSSHFRHYKVKDNKVRPTSETLYAGLFALASNMGAYQLSNTSVGINYDKLSNAITWYFTLDNLYEINESIINFMKKMDVTNLFKKEKQLLHSSSDGQKRCVTAESLNANFSYKYFGQGKGSNIYAFLDERGMFFYSTVFTSSDRDAPYVIDGLTHSDSIKPDMHSTDTHGYTEIIFAISHLLGIKFAPRIKNIKEQVLSSFNSIKKDLESKNYQILPSYKIRKNIIKDNWELILRLVASIKTKEFKASTILKRLNSYDTQHTLQDAIKEFGRIIKSIFLLEYIDKVELRQDIEKQLNKGELANKFGNAVAFANNQEIMQVHQEDQDVAVMCKLIVQNIIILWNYIELTKIIMRSDSLEKKSELIKNIKELSIISWQHINMFGLYDFSALKSTNDSEFKVEEILAYKAA